MARKEIPPQPGRFQATAFGSWDFGQAPTGFAGVSISCLGGSFPLVSGGNIVECGQTFMSSPGKTSSAHDESPWPVIVFSGYLTRHRQNFRNPQSQIQKGNNPPP